MTKRCGFGPGALTCCLALVLFGCGDGSKSKDSETNGQGGASAGAANDAGSAGSDEEDAQGGAAGDSGGAGGDNAGSGGQAGEPTTRPNSDDPRGVYVDDFGYPHRVTEQEWLSGESVFEFVRFDSANDLALARNGESNPYNPNLFSRFEWVTDSPEGLFYCQSVYDADSEHEAADAPRADANDLESGCGGFAWSQLVTPLLVGSYTDDYDGGHIITNQSWTMSGFGASTFELMEFSNQDGWILAQNGADNDYNPGRFSRFDWTTDEQDSLWYCQTAYDAETLEDARAAQPADREDLDTGCGGFAWSRLQPTS